MRHTVLFVFALFALLTLVVQKAEFATTEVAYAADSTAALYVGVKDCAKCHKKASQGEQSKLWQASGHAKAFETLKSPEAIKIAAEKGIAAAPHEAPECLKCHVAAYDAPPEMMGKKFKARDGVQCESCHGAGSRYKKKKIMKDRDASIAMGMNAVFVDDGSAEKMCRTCHNEESPTFKPFDFEKRWSEIVHPVPK